MGAHFGFARISGDLNWTSNYLRRNMEFRTFCIFSPISPASQSSYETRSSALEAVWFQHAYRQMNLRTTRPIPRCLVGSNVGSEDSIH